MEERRMDQEFHIDVDEVRHNLERSEVIALFFPYFRKTLLLDTRCSRVDPPMARVVPMVRSAEERVAELCRLRPRFDRPGSITLIPWPRYVASIKGLGVWQLIVDRLTAAGDPNSEVVLERCYRELLREERAESVRAVRGEGYETVWERDALTGS
jgi:hypothetical protein